MISAERVLHTRIILKDTKQVIIKPVLSSASLAIRDSGKNEVLLGMYVQMEKLKNVHAMNVEKVLRLKDI